MREEPKAIPVSQQPTKHTYNPCLKGVFHSLFKVKLNQPFHNDRRGGEKRPYYLKLKCAHLPLPTLSNFPCLYPGRNETITDCLSSMPTTPEIYRHHIIFTATRTKCFFFAFFNHSLTCNMKLGTPHRDPACQRDCLDSLRAAQLQ